MENWMFGCDICQDVCPWNRFSKKHNEEEFEPHIFHRFAVDDKERTNHASTAPDPPLEVVMATDIVDKELNQLRKNRWDKAFSSAIAHSEAGQTEDVNRKATIVIEHLIQASDVAHTMQHWHVYIKWNERLFHEMYEAYRAGRSEKNPADFWFNGEIGFFDFYIIPLARKLKDCGVFGVSSDEYLNYALANRNEWQTKGQQVVDAYMAKYENES